METKGGSVMADRNSIIEKIKALLSKTTENGATEPEMMSALYKASAMMDAYDISNEDVQLTKEEAAMLHADPPDLKDPHGIKWRLTYSISNFCNVQIYRSRRETGLKCIGMPSDVQLAMCLLDTLADFVFGELYGHLIGCCAPNSERRVIVRSFVEACCNRINDRLAGFVERSKVARTSNGRELVVVKDAAIKAFIKEHDIRLRTCSGSAPSNVNASAAAAGRSAGDRASFGRPVSGAGAALRIGRN
jgi:uncharacterized protein DUF2786